MKLQVDINVVKVFLESNFYHHIENCCGRFRHAFTPATSRTATTDSHFHPSPPSGQLAINWDET